MAPVAPSGMGEFSMSASLFRHWSLRHGMLALPLLLANTSAHAQLATEKSLPYAVTRGSAQAAREACEAQGFHVSGMVLGREGEILMATRGDGAYPHTMENARRKAY